MSNVRHMTTSLIICAYHACGFVSLKNHCDWTIVRSSIPALVIFVNFLPLNETAVNGMPIYITHSRRVTDTIKSILQSFYVQTNGMETTTFF